jgi:ribulose-phosphate 3-epimerase
MSKIKFITDSGSDLSKQFVEENNIDLLPIGIIMGDKSYRDWYDFSRKEFYKLLVDVDHQPQTSQVTPEMFLASFNKAIDEGYDTIVCVCLNAKASGTYQSSVIAKALLMEDGTKAHIRLELIDSTTYAYLYGRQIERAVEMAKNGVSVDNMIRNLRERCENIRAYGVVYDLRFLIKTGRISKVAGFMGEILDVKPILAVGDSQMIVCDKVRGKKKVYGRIVEMVKKNMDPGNDELLLVYGDMETEAAEIRQVIRKELGDLPILESNIGSVIATHSARRSWCWPSWAKRRNSRGFPAEGGPCGLFPRGRPRSIMKRRWGFMKLAPSVLSADFCNLERDIARALDAGADLIHVDVMDGCFVPNITLGAPVVESIRKRFPGALLDVHLMVEKPENHLDDFIRAGADYLSIQVESTYHAQRMLRKIKDAGIRAGAALNPSTPLSFFNHVLEDLDFALVMTVNPGFGGQKFIPQMLDKIASLKRMIGDGGYPVEIEADGGISPENIYEVTKAGVSIGRRGLGLFRERRSEKDGGAFQGPGFSGVGKKKTKGMAANAAIPFVARENVFCPALFPAVVGMPVLVTNRARGFKLSLQVAVDGRFGVPRRACDDLDALLAEKVEGAAAHAAGYNDPDPLVVEENRQKAGSVAGVLNKLCFCDPPVFGFEYGKSLTVAEVSGDCFPFACNRDFHDANIPFLKIYPRAGSFPGQLCFLKITPLRRAAAEAATSLRKTDFRFLPPRRKGNRC